MDDYKVKSRVYQYLFSRGFESREIRIVIDDLMGFKPLPGDDFLLVPESVAVVEHKVQADDNSSHHKVPLQVDVPHEADGFVAVTVGEKTQAGASEFEPDFSSNETCSDSIPDVAEKNQQLDNSDDVVHQEFVSIEQSEAHVETAVKQVSWLRKLVVIIVFLAVALMFVFYISDIKKMFDDIRNEASSAGIAKLAHNLKKLYRIIF